MRAGKASKMVLGLAMFALALMILTGADKPVEAWLVDHLAFMTSPRAHWTQIYSTNPLECLNAEIKRGTNAVGIFPHDASIVRWVGAMMLEQNDKWSQNRRYMQLEGPQTVSDTAPTRLCAVAR